MAIPTDYAGLKIWLKADAIVGLADGEKVATWSDSSGQDNHFTQGTDANRPVYKTNQHNTLPVVRFTAADAQTLASSFSVANEANLTIFLVVKFTQTTTQMRAVNTTGGTNGVLVLTLSGKSALVLVPSVYRQFSSTSTAFQIQSWRYTGGTPLVEAWKDRMSQTLSTAGTVPSTTGAAAGTWIMGGVGSAYMDGDIAEFIVYYGALDDPQREAIETYVYNKYTGSPAVVGGDMSTVLSKRLDSVQDGKDINTRMRTVCNTAYTRTDTDLQFGIAKYVTDLYTGAV